MHSATGNPDPSQPPVTLLYLSWSTLVSPNGEYAAMSAEREARLPVSPGGTTPTLNQATCGHYMFEHLCDSAPLFPPDTAFNAVVRATAGGYTSSQEGTPIVFQWSSADLAYRPDGKMLATILPDAVQPVTADSAMKRITLFDMSSGQFNMVSAPTQANATFDDPGVPPIVWSPSGKQFAYFDYFSSTVTLWGGSSLTS